ncbi:Helix-turn-helix domain-containing protein [Micromonospora pallida]|uniref:Helix-turn-helix domain-containing protein n=1 Tax=Micromonospora pallida TaxID=145854 RepID=A0A1C6RSS6_9ACTN|nr:helix-turn-helix transcriptional regulator [Micromonospora pallida]SCL20266.1 Helix-turn-helix domain-containing protein [Micromonospora pallida]
MPTLDSSSQVAEYFAINLRKTRETRGLSQADLAQRVKELGHPCTQATIWKLEQGHREPKLSEVAAIGAALDLWSWTELTTKPATFNAALVVDQWRQRAFALAEQTRAAAVAQLEALEQLAFAVRAALDAGLPVEWAERRSGGWLEFTPEATVLRAVLAGRVDFEVEDEELDRRMAEQERLAEQVLGALESSGVPLAIKPDDIEFVEAEDQRHDEGSEASA